VFVVEKGQFGRGQRWVWSEGVCFFREAFLEGGIVGIVFLPGVHKRLEILEGKSVGSDKTLKSREFIMRAEVEEGGMEEVSVGRSSKEILGFFILSVGVKRIVLGGCRNTVGECGG
jgi:hypothetical protein